jgi:GR25 family glycosyltransferase involved in LPS biosynthesis
MYTIVISLERAQERRDFIKSQLDKLSIDASVMDAIDAEKLTQQDKDKKLSLIGGYRYGEKFLPGEIACTMSHIKALEIAKKKIGHI